MTILRRTILAGIGLAVLPRLAAAHASPFSAQAFEAAQAADRPILVDVTASWCPTCRTQKPILARLLADPRFAEMAAFEVDYDRQKDVVRRFEARMQSTLIVFRGRDELGRSVGDTNPASIMSLLEMTL
ncbi:MAG: thioredoxin family protein [Alphaproteobacteria bacterium]|jgi:thiol-disulfide isomerase/thioredoxin